MNGNFPGSDQIAGLAVCGLALGAFLILGGYRGTLPRNLTHEYKSSRWESAPAFQVQGLGRLPLRTGIPTQEGGQRKLAPCQLVLLIGTRVNRLSQDSVDGTLWYLVRVSSGPETGAQGWVEAQYLHPEKA